MGITPKTCTKSRNNLSILLYVGHMINVCPQKKLCFLGVTQCSRGLSWVFCYVVTIHKPLRSLGSHWGNTRPQFFSCVLNLTKFQSYNNMMNLFQLFIYSLGMIVIRTPFIKQRLLHKIDLAGGIFF